MIRTGIHGHNGPGVVGTSMMGSSIGAAPRLWWDPNNVGLSVIGAYRAIATIGSPWPLAPANYAQSLLDWSGTSPNLIEGFGAVPWAPPTGWGFVAAAAQWLDTSLISVNDQSWSLFIQYANNAAANTFLGKVRDGPRFGILPNLGGASVRYSNSANLAVVPALNAGNIGVAGAQGYRNGIADGGAIGVIAGAFVNTFPIGGRKNAGVMGNFCTADIHAVAIYDAGPAAVQAEALAIATAMSQL